MNKRPHTHTTKLNSDHRRKASPQVQGGRIADAYPRVRLSARNLDEPGTTGILHLQGVIRPLRPPQGDCWSYLWMPDLKTSVTATAIEIEGVEAVKIEVVMPMSEALTLLDLVVATVLRAKGLVV